MQLMSTQYEENHDPHALMAIARELENKSLITVIQNSEIEDKRTITKLMRGQIDCVYAHISKLVNTSRSDYPVPTKEEHHRCLK